MKRNDLKEIKTLEINDLRLKIKEAKNKLAEIIMEKSESTKGAKNVKVFFIKRKDIAQMMTVLKQKEMLVELGLKDRSHLGGGHKESKV